MEKTFEEYLKNELEYYDEHPEEDDPLECHSNSLMGSECEYKWQLKKCHIISSICVYMDYN